MKSVFIILLFIFLLSCSEKKKNGSVDEHMFGSVKSISDNNYLANIQFGVIQKDSLLNSVVKQYDEYGKLINEIFYKGEGKIFASKILFDEYENKIKEINPKFAFNFEFKYKVSENGKVIEENKYILDELMGHKTIYKFDERGYKIEEDRYVSLGDILSDEDDGNDRNFKIKIICRNDENGNMTEQKIYNDNDSLLYQSTFNYSEFDKKKNWMKRIELENNIPKKITEREIEYY